VVIVRYADDIVVGVDKESDARSLVQAMRSRLEQFELTLHPEKTQVIRFGRFAAANRVKRGLGKPPNVRFDATHPRQEPGARIVHAGICAGGAR
jgi:hypothetical protein